MQYAERTIEAYEFRCGSCAYFKARAIYEQPCASLGAKENSPPCMRYTINPQRWDHPTRAKILQALHLLHEAKVAITDIKGLLHGAENLPEKYALGSRLWIVVGKGKDAIRMRCTVIGKTTWTGKFMPRSDKFTLMSETGAILNVSDAELIPDHEVDPLDFNLSFDITLKKKPKKEKEKTESLPPVIRITLRGEDTPAPTPTAKTKKAPKIKTKAPKIKPVVSKSKPVKTVSKR